MCVCVFVCKRLCTHIMHRVLQQHAQHLDAFITPFFLQFRLFQVPLDRFIIQSTIARMPIQVFQTL